MAEDQEDVQTVQGADLGSVPEMTQEEFDAYLQTEGGEPGAPPVSEEEEEAEDSSGSDGDGGESGDGDNEGDESDGDEDDAGDKNKYIPGASLKAFAEANQLTFNADQIPEDFTAEQELALLNQFTQRTVTNVRKGVEDANTLAKLYKEDQEVQDFLAARAQGKTMKDYVKELGGTPEFTDAESLVAKYLKEENLLDEEAVAEEIETLKERGKLDAKKEIVTKFYNNKAKLESDAAEAQRLADEQAAENEKKRLDAQYADVLRKTNKVGEFALTKEIKEDLYKYATLEDQDGFNGLEHDLQSDENVLMASLAIKYKKQFIAALQNGAIANTKDSLLDQLTADDPSKLQSGTNRGKKKVSFDPSGLDSF